MHMEMIPNVSSCSFKTSQAPDHIATLLNVWFYAPIACPEASLSSLVHFLRDHFSIVSCNGAK